MQFNSVEFLIFFPIVVLLYFALPQRWRLWMLLAASYYFYMAWRAEYLLLLICSTLFDYAIALYMEALESPGARRMLLFASLSVNLGLLFVFKYFNFFSDSARYLLNQFNLFYQVPTFHLLLPVGISFYTFQSMSYVIDVYRGKQKAERNLGVFALFVAFFPQLVAGPIERSTAMLPQFLVRHRFDYDRVTSGLRRMAWGFFKKVVIADKAALIVDAIYNDPTHHQGLPLLMATYLFAFQIYCDFSGYSDIAIGAARVLGFDLMENFRQPYLARSIADFWRRWHISLSSWFRDYLYIPLGGNRVGQPRLYANLFLVFLVSGLWHGASWTFVTWGALHGIYMVLGVALAAPWTQLLTRLELRRWPALLNAVQMLVIFHLVLFAWIFFRARTMPEALYITTHLFAAFPWTLNSSTLHVSAISLVVLGLAIVGMELIEQLRTRHRLRLTVEPFWMRWSAYYLLVAFILLFGELNRQGQFIYFQF